MGQLKKRGYKGLASGGSGTGDEPPLNNPFLAAKQKLQATVKPEPKKAEQKPWLTKAGKKPPPPEPKEERLSDEEMFRQEMFGVSRLGAAQGRARPIEQEREVVLRQSEEAEAYAQLSDLVEGVGPFDISDSDEYIEGIAPGLDKRLLSRLRRGDYAVQGHVDLHGLTREEARIRVEQFVAESLTRGHRCVLIVHGRGLNSKDQIPVLKEAVRLWLVRGRIARSVLCFATARPTDGGAGAVYVLLRR